MTYQDKLTRILDMTKCMRLVMQDAAAANDRELRQGYWNTAEAWGRKIDAAIVELNLTELKKNTMKPKYIQPDLFRPFIRPPEPSKDLTPISTPREKDRTCPQPEPTPIYEPNAAEQWMKI
jgi:hypothetical protein